MTRLVTRIVAGGGPNTSLAAARAQVNDLRSQAARAPQIVADITGLTDHLDQVRDVPVRVVDRVSWVDGASATFGAMLGDDVDATALRLGLAALSRGVLGQFDPFGSGTLYLVAPNVAQFRDSYNLDRRDLALWVAVHELTHAIQFAAAPWLVDEIARRIPLIANSTDAAEHKRVFDEITAIMSLLEGHATYVMDQVPIAILPSRQRLVRALAARRASGNWLTKKLRSLIGVGKKNAQYATGENFTSYVIDAVGMDGFNRVWERAENLPTMEEIRNPQAWIERVA